MKWIFLSALAAIVFFGCERDDTPEASQIVMVEAPTRLPLIASIYDPQPYETTAVRFVVKLDPPVAEVDTIVCNVFDFLGGKVDSFLLFDDGGVIEHWENTPCESALTGDSIASDGMFTRSVHAEEFTVNYVDADYTFMFYANSHRSEIRGAQYTAVTWQPWFELVSIQITPEFIPPCADSMVIETHLRRDSTDTIESVAVGFPGYQNQLYRTLSDFTALAGDSVWRVAVAHDNGRWSDLDLGGLVIGISGRLGRYITMPITSFYSDQVPSVDLSATADTFRVSNFGVPETLFVHAAMSLCESRIPDRAAGEVLPLSAPAHWTVNFSFAEELNDCGWYGDALAGDGLFTTFLLITADSLAREFSGPLRVRVGASASSDPCDWLSSSNFVGQTEATKLVTVLPPQ